MHTVESINAISEVWAGAMTRSLVEGSILMAVVVLAWLPLRRKISSQLAYGLFFLVLVKSACPFPVELPAALHRLTPGSLAESYFRPNGNRQEAIPSPPIRENPTASAGRDPSDQITSSALTGSDEIEFSGTPSPIVVEPTSPTRSAQARVSMSMFFAVPSPSAKLMLAWLAVTATLLARLVWVHVRMSHRLRDAQVLDTAAMSVDYAALCDRCELRTPVPMIVTPWVTSPAVWGLCRPRILVPPGLVESLTPGQLTWVLLHELVHVRRGDGWIVLFQRVVQIVYVFHPGVWVANRLIDLQREYTCDDAAIALADEVPRHDCASGFLTVIERASACPAGACPALGLFGSHTFLRRRMMRILDSRRSMRRRLSFRAALSLGLLAVAVLPYVRAREQDRPATSVKSESAKAPAMDVEIRVLHDEDGKALEGARVEAKFYREGYTYRLGTTDAEGRCKITVPFTDASFMFLSAEKDGFIPLSLGWEYKDLKDGLIPPYTFRLTRGTAIGLYVHDEQGKPIAGVKVVPWYRGKIGGSGKEQFNASDATAKITDAQGRWQADIIPAKSSAEDKVMFRLIHLDHISDNYGFSRTITAEEARSGKAVQVMKTGLPVAGRILDDKGKPVADAAVALGYSNSDTNCDRTKTDADGRFRFTQVDPSVNHDLTLAVEAVGFAPIVTMLRPAADLPSQEVRLEPGKVLSGRVLDRQGKPVAGAAVKFDHFGGSRHWNWKGDTDAEGRFTWPDGPSAGEVSFNASKPPFTRAYGRTLAAGTNFGVITLNMSLRLRGKVLEAETGKPIDKFVLIPGWGPDRPGGQVSWRRDGSSKTLTGGAYDETGLFDNQGLTRSLRIEADGYAPEMSEGFKDDAGEIVHDFKLKKAVGFGGIVTGPDGQPLRGAVVALTNLNLRPYILNGAIPEFVQSPGTTEVTRADGLYSFRAQEEPTGILVVANEGFMRKAPWELVASGDVRVEPWGRVEGTCRIGEKPVSHQKIRLSVDATAASSTDYEFYEYEAETDADGKFVVERVIPGDASATTATPQGANRGLHGSIGSGKFEVRSGETAKATIGGSGRPVIGRVQVPDGSVVPVNLSTSTGNLRFKSHVQEMKLPDDFMTWEFPKRKAYSLAWYKSPEGKAWRRGMRGNGIKVESDGSFRAEEVLPGSYELTITVGGDGPVRPTAAKSVFRATVKRDVVVPEIPGGHSDQPLDLKTLDLEVDVKQLKTLDVGQPAPPFATTTLDGKPLHLADYRGRYVVLDFWATWCIPCLEQEPSLKAAFEAFGKDPRFALLSLSLDEKVETPKAYLAKRELGWTQAFLGEWSKTTVPSDYGVTSIPSIWLIGPDGNVLGKNLRGDAIKAAVEKALRRE